MNAIDKKLADFLPQEMLALLEKIETLEGAETDFAIAEYINCSALTKFERFMLVRAYRRFESRQARFRAMELLFPSPKKEYTQEKYAYGSAVTTASTLGTVTLKREGSSVINGYQKIQKSRVGNI